MERSRSRPSSPKPEVAVEHLLRPLAPQVLGGLVHRYRNFDQCEDAVQEAMLEAALQWPSKGVPENPRGWLTTVASRRLTDWLRSDEARRRREDRFAAAPAARAAEQDDSLAVLLMCAHPDLTAPSQIALTLRAVGGLTTAEIAAALFVPEATMGQRISRAKSTIADAAFELPEDDQAARLPTVLHVLYLIFNEGYTASSGTDLARVDLTAEAIRLTRMVHRLRPADPEVAGLLALMLLTDARIPARTGPDGDLVPLAEQDRSLWRRDLIDEGTALITGALPSGPVGPYQLQAAIAAVHVEAASADETDWPQVLALYGLLEQVAPGPMVTLNRAVAVAEVHGPAEALGLIDALETDERMARHHRLHAVRAHLLERTGDAAAAAESYRTAASLTASLPERRYLEARAGLPPG